MKRKILITVVLAVLMLVTAPLSFAENKISILVSGQSHASLYPCRCPSNPSGGVSRRSTAIKEARIEERNVLVLESGGSFAGGSYDTNSQTTELDKQRTKFYMESLVKMGYDAALLSSEEFNFGDDFLKEVTLQYPLDYLSANLKGEFKPYIIKEIAGIKIAVIGITDSQVKDKTKTQYLKAEKTLKDTIKNIKSNKQADLIIVLSYLSQPEAIQLIEAVDGVDILISSNNPFKQANAQKVGEAISIQTGWETRGLTKINLSLSDLVKGEEIRLTLDEEEFKDKENKNLMLVEAEIINLGQDIKDDDEVRPIIPECFKDTDCVKTGSISKCENPAAKESKCVFSQIKKVGFIVIKPVTCRLCNIEAVIARINKILPDTEVQYLDEDTPQAKEIIKELGIRVLPVYLIEQSSIEDEAISAMGQALVKQGNYYMVDPSFTGISYFVNREKIPNRLDVFFDITTPEMVKILDVLQELKNKRPEIDIHLNFLAIEDPEKGIISKNGRYEVEEFLRGACINKYYPDRLWYYLSCRLSDIESTWWDDCAVKFGMDSGKIKGCAQAEEGKMLLKDLIKLTQELKVVFGPTFLINNQEVLSSQGAPSEEELEKLFSALSGE